MGYPFLFLKTASGCTQRSFSIHTKKAFSQNLTAGRTPSKHGQEFVEFHSESRGLKREQHLVDAGEDTEVKLQGALPPGEGGSMRWWKGGVPVLTHGG